MPEEMIDVNVRLDKTTVDTLNKMTKKELIERICVIALETKVAEEKAEAFKLRCTVAIEDAEKAQFEAKRVQLQLEKAQEYNTQAQVMIEAITGRWDHYDV